MKWKPALAALLVISALLFSGAPGFSAPPPAEPQTASSSPRDMDKLMKEIQTLCADPESSACIQALNRIEPCGIIATRSDSRTTAENGPKPPDPACF